MLDLQQEQNNPGTLNSVLFNPNYVVVNQFGPNEININDLNTPSILEEFDGKIKKEK